jgi:hypothetical protein
MVPALARPRIVALLGGAQRGGRNFVVHVRELSQQPDQRIAIPNGEGTVKLSEKDLTISGSGLSQAALAGPVTSAQT